MELLDWLEVLSFYMQLLELSYSVQCVLYDELEAERDEIENVNNTQNVTNIFNTKYDTSSVYYEVENRAEAVDYFSRSSKSKSANSFYEAASSTYNTALEMNYSVDAVAGAKYGYYEEDRLSDRERESCFAVTESESAYEKYLSEVNNFASVLSLSDRLISGSESEKETSEKASAEFERTLEIGSTAELEGTLCKISELSERCFDGGNYGREVLALEKASEIYERLNFSRADENTEVGKEVYLSALSDEKYIGSSEAVGTNITSSLTELLATGNNDGGRGDININVDFKAYATVNNDKEIEKLADVFVKRLEDELSYGSEGIHF
jgi:hypothetical protein